MPTAARAQGKLLFASNQEGGWRLYAMNPDGRTVARLTRATITDGANFDAGEEGAVGSPDGSVVAFQDHGRLALIRADGSRRRLLSDCCANHLAWSPDGTRVAYVIDRKRRFDIVVLNVATGGRRIVARDVWFEQFSWSPDGTKIVYTPISGAGLRIFDLTSSTVSAMRTRPSRAYKPAWSPDGSRIAFTDFDGDDIYIRTVDGVAAANVATIRQAYQFRWSPDGRRLLYTHNQQVFTARRDGTGRLQITRIAWMGTGASEPVWSPDGTRIAYAVGRFCGSTFSCQGDLFVVNADGSGTRRLTNAFAEDGGTNDVLDWTSGPVQGSRVRPTAVKRTTIRPFAELKSKHRLGPFAAAGGRVIWTPDGRFAASTICVNAWIPGIGSAGPLRCAGEVFTWIDDLTTTQETTAWIESWEEGYSSGANLYAVTASSPQPTKVVRADNLGHLQGDGALLAYNAWTREEGTGRVRQPQLWVHADGASRLVRTGEAAMWVADVDRDLIALVHPVGAVEVVTTTGQRLRQFGGPSQRLSDAQLAGPHLLVIGRRTLDTYDLATGRRLKRWPLVLGVSRSARLEDADGRLAVYVAGVALHVLRLADGRDVTLRLPDQALLLHSDLSDSWLVYSWNRAFSRKPGRIGVVTLAALDAALAQDG